MPLTEQRVFIQDSDPNLSIREKNEELAAKLAVAPAVKFQIVRIERIEIGASGWWIYHRTGRP